jgi:hypothetical protein
LDGDVRIHQEDGIIMIETDSAIYTNVDITKELEYIININKELDSMNIEQCDRPTNDTHNPESPAFHDSDMSERSIE